MDPEVTAEAPSAPLGSGFVGVDELARRRGVTPHAVRKLLRTGHLAGEQVPLGGRTVWRIPTAAAERYVAAVTARAQSGQRRAAQRAAATSPLFGVQSPSPRSTAGVPSRPQTHAGSEDRFLVLEATLRISALEGEVGRLRGQLRALAAAYNEQLAAHSALVEGLELSR